jgi:hypothetical protein
VKWSAHNTDWLGAVGAIEAGLTGDDLHDSYARASCESFHLCCRKPLRGSCCAPKASFCTTVKLHAVHSVNRQQSQILKFYLSFEELLAVVAEIVSREWDTVREYVAYNVCWNASGNVAMPGMAWRRAIE